MSVRLNPCFGCPLREGCEQRDEWRRKVSGLGLRSATFRCDKLDAEIRPGRRIEIGAYVVRSIDRDDGSMRMGKKDVRATITTVLSGGRFCCTVAPGQLAIDDMPHDGIDIDKIRFRRPLRPQRIRRFLLGPDAEICKVGARVMVDGKCDGPPGSPCQCEEDRKFLEETESLF